MAKMTLTQALVELKKLDSQIKRSTSQQFIGYVTGSGIWEKTSDRRHADKAQAEKAYQAALDQVQSLITRRTTIKSAVVQANATTKVKVGDVEMTIAEAIERKNSISIQQSLLGTLIKQHAEVVNTVTRLDHQTNTEISQLRETLSSTGKLDDTKLKQGSEDIMTKQKASLVDPNKLSELIDKLTAEIEDFLSNVDVALSVANATTEIDV